MDTYHSTNNESGIIWYLDSNSNNEDTKDESIESTCARQPWRSYWPPKCQKMTEMWLRSEFPEVLSWRFDRTRPFDRPWRTWNRSAQKVGICFFVCHDTDLLLNPTVSQHKSLLQATSTPSSQARSNEIFDLIKGMKFHYVNSATFHFLVPLDLYNTEKPYLSRLPSGTDLARTNIVTESHALKVFNVSGHESLFALDRSGFQFAKCPIQVRRWTDNYVCSEYIPKIEEWLTPFLRAHCGKGLLYFQAHSISPPRYNRLSLNLLDATEASCFKRLQLYFPDKAHNMMKSRVRNILHTHLQPSPEPLPSVWRAISTPNQDCPLAFCDFRTVRRDDLVPADIIFPHYQDEAYEVLYNPDQRWFYKKGMECDDVILFKLADNSPDEAPFCPHSAFMDHSTPEGTPSRVSIEVRSIIFD
ncbi:hypothetical protein BDZ45DRAFT_590152 [Acephala macrosclerotiorum]|nr:hypothetical protein BDZ45DRAFT_590152 [Acephala macrosclerotiorum]